jgi:hypothetical protein
MPSQLKTAADALVTAIRADDLSAAMQACPAVSRAVEGLRTDTPDLLLALNDVKLKFDHIRNALQRWKAQRPRSSRLSEAPEVRSHLQPFLFYCVREYDRILKRDDPVGNMLAEMGGDHGNGRLAFDDNTLTVTLDGRSSPISDPQAYRVYKTIADYGSPGPITKASIATRVPGTRGRKTIPKLLKSLPSHLKKTVHTTTRGFSLKLPPIKKGASRTIARP